MRRLLLLLCPLVLAETAIAFDGGVYETEKKAKLSTNQSKTKTLAKYSEFHQSCMDIQRTMWGEVSELMEDLATAHCYCEYTKIEDLDTITWGDENAADVACAREGMIRKKGFYLVGSSTTPSTARSRSAIVPAHSTATTMTLRAENQGIWAWHYEPTFNITEICLTGAWALRLGNAKQPFVAWLLLQRFDC